MKVNKKFVDNFNLVMAYYDCEPDEIIYEKQRVRDNFNDAERCYSVLAACIENLSEENNE